MLPIIFDHMTYIKLPENVTKSEWKDKLEFKEKIACTYNFILVGEPGQIRYITSTDTKFDENDDCKSCFCNFSWKSYERNKKIWDKHDKQKDMFSREVIKKTKDFNLRSKTIQKKWAYPQIDANPIDHRYGYLASMEYPDWLQTFEYDEKEMNIMYYDIEVETTGTVFPRPETNPIYAIGYCINNGPIKKLHIDFEGDLHDRYMDKEIIEKFLDILIDEKVDMIVGYNSQKFDNNYMFRRAMINNIAPIRFACKFIQEDVKMSEFYLEVFDQLQLGTLGHVDDIFMGYIMYDIYGVSVSKDQSLYDLKNRKMKTLAEHYKIKYQGNASIELAHDDISNTRKMVSTPNGSASLLHYLESDVNITRDLSKNIYLQQEMSASQLLNIPIASILYRDRGTLPSVAIESTYRKAGIIPVDSNIQRRYEIFEKATGNKPYQGAIVDILKTGNFSKVWKLDYSGMYPAADRNLNASPETISLIGYDKPPYGFDDIRSYEINIEDKTGDIIFKIPDDKQDARVILRITQQKEGLVTEAVREAVESRKEWKIKATEHEGMPEFDLYNSYSLFYKVIANSIYGIMGNKSSPAGDILVALAITGFCRLITLKTIEILGKDSVIEIDTDGYIISTHKYADCNLSDKVKLGNKIYDRGDNVWIYPNETPIPDAIFRAKLTELEANQTIENFVINECGLSKNFMFVELEDFGAGYFYASKNYILEKPTRNPDGSHSGYKLVKHGNNFKSSRLPAVGDQAIEIMSKCLIYNEYDFETASKKCHNFSKLTLEDYVITLRTKGEEQYNDTLSQKHILTLIKEFKQIYGIDLQESDTVDFVYDRNRSFGVTLAAKANLDSVNTNYYHDIVSGIIRVFSREQVKSRNIFKLGAFGSLSKKNI